MKSSDEKKETTDKKRYVFFSDPDVIAKRAETSAIAAQISREFETRCKTLEKQSTDLSISGIGIRNVENLLSYYPVQPYPFTFISAVKQKLALEDCINIDTKTHESTSGAKISVISPVMKAATSAQSLNTQNQKMEFIKPLKAPDLKISPKTLDFSSRESSISKELSSTKSDMATREFAHDRFDKSLRTGERVQRKLDFSSDGSSFINYETIEPLKAPNVFIASNLTKKKDHARDSSREKENRSKRMKKDDSLCAKRDDSVQDQVKRSRSPRRLSRKNANDVSNIKISKNEKVFHAAKNNDFPPTKSKDRSFVASATKKDDKRQRSFNAQSTELTKDNLAESKIRISNNETSVFPSWKMSDKVTLRDNVSVLSSTENKSKDMRESHYFLKQKPDMEDSKHKSDSDSRQLQQDKLNTIYKEQIKRISDKNKVSNNKAEDKLHNVVDSEPSEDVEFISTETNNSRNRISAYPVSSIQSSKSKDLEMGMDNKQNFNPASRSTKTSENCKCTEHFIGQSSNTSQVKKDEESCSQSCTVATKETKEIINDDSNDVDDSILPDALFDPRRISLREDYSQQEFHNLMTPEKMNLVLRSKRRRYLMQSSDSEVDARCPKYKSVAKSEKEQEDVQLIHPTALHMQFQAELHLYDSYNESLRQVMDVEKCLYNTKCEMQEQKNPQKVDETDDKGVVQILENSTVAIDNDAIEKTILRNPSEHVKKDESRRSSDEMHFSREHYIPNQGKNIDETGYGFNHGKFNKTVKVAEVQTQTVNDIATQTDITDERNAQNGLSEIRENAYEPFLRENEIPQLSLDSAEHFEDMDQIEEMSLPSRIRTMSEISLHETTSSIKTETGTEISISTRDVTCSFNQFIGLEIARLLKDENQRSSRIEELFKFREKTLNDKTKKLAELEEQKRALRDTGQDSRSVKKKQRALLLKLQQEKDEIQRLKLLYEITSQERKRMLQKQRDMFNPQMSTKNILTKLKRTADSQSPRRLSGPMKGYDIRSNSSMSSLIDSDKSQHDRSQIDTRLQASESDASKLDWFKSNILSLAEERNTSAARLDRSKEQENDCAQSQRRNDMSRYELRSRKYEEKMPRAEVLRLKQNQLDMESKRIQGHPMKINIRLLENRDQIRLSQSPRAEKDGESVPRLPDSMKSECGTLVEELSKKTSITETLSQRSRTSNRSQVTDHSAVPAAAKDSTCKSSSIREEINTISKTTQSQISETSQTSVSKNSRRIDKSVTSDRDPQSKKSHSAEPKTSSKRKNSKYQKTKSSSSVSTENILRSKSSSHVSREVDIKHHDKRTRLTENESLRSDSKESLIVGELESNNESRISIRALVEHSRAAREKTSRLSSEATNERDVRDASASEISTFAVSHHSSEESEEKNLSRSIVVRSREDREFEEILNARETALASRKNCVEEWMAWHARLRAEEDRVARMEQAAFKLVAAASNVLCQQGGGGGGGGGGGDTTVSSDTSDVEGRIGHLTEKLAKRRLEMARLKREAKKQAKKQLRALEANLLNQIKRYDITIHEMRKKLESKRAVKETDKLAIEPKSLADFKVPEIPLKRIQDIYKSSDLLRSRSESDLLSTKNQRRDSLRNAATPLVRRDDKRPEDSFRRSVQSSADGDTNGGNATVAFVLKATEMNRARIVIDDTSTGEYDKIRTVPSASSISNDARSGNGYVLSTESRMLEESVGDGDDDDDDVDVDVDVGRTDSDAAVRSQLEARTTGATVIEDRGAVDNESANDGSIARVDRSRSRTSTILSEIPFPEMGNVESECSRIDNSSVLAYSKKLDFLQLNNKNLSDDINSIEKDIKALSEIMSRLSDESSKTSKASNDERNTSRDISEVISKSSVFNDRIIDREKEERRTMSADRKSVSSNGLDMNGEISAAISEEVPTVSDFAPEEIDYEARSREIMNEIEKSVLSHHVGIARENEKLSNDNRVIRDELDRKSISEIPSEIEGERSDPAKNVATRIVDEPRDSSEPMVERKLAEKDREEETRSPRLSESFGIASLQSPIIAGHRSKENRKTSRDVSRSLASESPRDIPETEYETDVADDSKTSEDVDEDVRTEVLDTADAKDGDDWTMSDSFRVPRDDIGTWNNVSEKSVSRIDDARDRETSLPSKEESVDVEVRNAVASNDGTIRSRDAKSNDELDDILDIIARESRKERESVAGGETLVENAISDSMAEILNEVRNVVEGGEDFNSHLKELLSDVGVNDRMETISRASRQRNEAANVEDKSGDIREGIVDDDDTSSRRVDDKCPVDVNSRVEVDNEENSQETASEIREIVTTELDSNREIETEEEDSSTARCGNEDERRRYIIANGKKPVEMMKDECLERDSSDGEQLDNLIEVAVSEPATVERIAPSRDGVLDSVSIMDYAGEERADDVAERNVDETFDVPKDPEYEDISEESLEVSEILDKDDFSRTSGAKKPAGLPERYETSRKTEEEDALRILDEISRNNERTVRSATEIGEAPGAEVSSPEVRETTLRNKLEREERSLGQTRREQRSVGVDDSDDLSERKVMIPSTLEEDKSSRILDELRKRVSQLQEQNGSSESSEAGDTPRGVSEIEMDSPRDFNDSRLDIDILDDDLLSGTKAANRNIDMETNFHSASLVATSDKDIEAKICELKASLGQPGQDLAELQAKLLRIEQLQIELEIKKLEAEEVSYYVREIPNKPPPPYTPPGDDRLSASLGSPSSIAAVIPSSVEELTSFTEKATTLIYNAKLAGEDIANLEAPPEIYELTRDQGDERDRRIYNTFLFDLCKETIMEVYRAEYEKPGPSWTKPNVKIKPTVKTPRNVEELIEYVDKEVATLFGFKTKLQRENMVMRWSRKRRDRVDELLAREAQAEEDEWTKFHRDELAVKNGLTVAILDALVIETANVIKIAYGKKRRMMV